jgi:hypothetical protein
MANEWLYAPSQEIAEELARQRRILPIQRA